MDPTGESMIRYQGMRVALSGSGDVGYSQIIPMSGFNSCGLSVVMLQLSGTTPDVNVKLQVSIDKENWSEPSVGPAGSQDVDAVGAVPLDPITPIVAPYLRLKFTLTGDVGIFSVDLTKYNI